jgi:hypothetical protein
MGIDKRSLFHHEKQKVQISNNFNFCTRIQRLITLKISLKYIICESIGAIFGCNMHWLPLKNDNGVFYIYKKVYMLVLLKIIGMLLIIQNLILPLLLLGF